MGYKTSMTNKEIMTTSDESNTCIEDGYMRRKMHGRSME